MISCAGVSYPIAKNRNFFIITSPPLENRIHLQKFPTFTVHPMGYGIHKNTCLMASM
jgi:hypothetical protein